MSDTPIADEVAAELNDPDEVTSEAQADVAESAVPEDEVLAEAESGDETAAA